MRNLILFLIRYNAFLVFILLEALSVYLMISNNSFHETGFMKTANNISGYVFTRYQSVMSYVHLKKENEKLVNENAYLRSLLPGAFYDDSYQVVSVSDTNKKQIYTYIPSRVIKLSTNQFNNYITINKGTLQGIKPRMAVISPDGIVGIVKQVTPHFSSIITLLHQDLEVSGRIGVEGFVGSVYWDGKDYQYAKLKEIPKQIVIKKGDKVTTSGGSIFFPENIVIGTVSSFTKETEDNFYDITIRLNTDFSTLQTVYVVNYLLQDEQQQLEPEADK
ncbi:MAG: rod shape-determining protein MreC [Bacteroidota bacterium]|jgi:rod shape-determining protein MreC